jgi:hypothetical protein
MGADHTVGICYNIVILYCDIANKGWSPRNFISFAEGIDLAVACTNVQKMDMNSLRSDD